MFPGINGFHWTPGHIIFLALFFGVVLTLLVTVARAALRSVRDFRHGRAGQLCWQLEFADLPAGERRCRHEIAGRIPERACSNAFDCRECGQYEQIAAIPAQASAGTCGLDYPADRLYHRGHTWVRPEADGTYTVGLDDLAGHVIGTPDAVELPPAGTRVEANSPAWRVRKGRHETRVRSPIDGEVVAAGGPAHGWYLRIRPDEPQSLRHLLRGHEVGAWVSKELERLQLQLGQPGAAPSLADGGILVSGLIEAMPQADWDTALAGTFLES
jgi:glycine cleavage system H protein